MASKSVLMICGLLTVGALIGGTSVTYADSLSQYQSKASQVRAEASNTKGKIVKLNQTEAVLKQEIYALQGQITALQNSIVNTQAALLARNHKIAALKAQIAATQVKINAQYQVLKIRVQMMYEDGTSSYLAVLFSANSFSDLLDRLELLSMIAQQDQQMLNAIQSSKAMLVAQNQSLVSQQQQQQTVFRQLTLQQGQQESKVHQQVLLLGDVHSQKLKQEADLNSENASLRSLQSLITSLQAQEGAYTGPSSGWTWPVPNDHVISSPYGWRTWPDGTHEFHDGIDIAAPLGTPMVSATAGKVLYAGPASGFGDWIVVESSGGLLEVYGHMYSYEILVHSGEIVREGQQIASVGSNGFSTGPHLHFTIATGFDASGFPISVNPTQYVG